MNPRKFMSLSSAALAGTAMLMLSMAPALALNPQPLPPGLHHQSSTPKGHAAGAPKHPNHMATGRRIHKPI